MAQHIEDVLRTTDRIIGNIPLPTWAVGSAEGTPTPNDLHKSADILERAILDISDRPPWPRN